MCVHGDEVTRPDRKDRPSGKVTDLDRLKRAHCRDLRTVGADRSSESKMCSSHCKNCPSFECTVAINKSF